MKEISGFKQFFVNDLLKRGQLTVEKASEDAYEKLSQFNFRSLRKVTEGIPALDPLNLIFFVKQIIDLNYIEENKCTKVIKAFFDLSIGYAFIFKKQADFFIGLELIKTAKLSLKAF